MGIFLDGFDLFIIAVAIPLIAVAFHCTATQLGLIGASAPIGCIFGALLFGRLTDKLGRKVILLIDLVFFVVFAGLSAFSWSIASLIVFRFILGIGIGADYPVSSTYITENMPKKLRGRMMVSGFGFQALGCLAGALLGIAILSFHPEINAWRWMLGIAVFPAIIILSLRTFLPESPRWLLAKGKQDKAEKVASKIAKQSVNFDQNTHAESKSSFFELFSKKYLRRTTLTALSWFIMDIALYSMGFFTTFILASMAFGGHDNFIAKDIAATQGTAVLDILLIAGIFFAILLIDKLGRIKLQSVGFIGMTVGLIILASSSFLTGNIHLAMIFVGFGLFNLMVNMGPNPTTYLLPAEIFPTRLRATGHGFASASGKIGAAVGIFLLPTLKAEFGLAYTLYALAGICVIGYIITTTLGYETKGQSLEDLEMAKKELGKAGNELHKVQEDIAKLNTDLKSAEKALSSAIKKMNPGQKPT